MNFARSFTYLRTHWNGMQGLGWSFWVNLVTLRVVISAAHSMAVVNRAPDAAPLSFALITLWILADMTVFFWQVVGVLRAGDHHLRQLGSVTHNWGTQLGALIAFLIVLSDIWGVLLMGKPATDAVSFSEQMALERAGKYNLQLSDDKRTLKFSGEIAPGTTKSVAAFLAANPDVDTLSLSSGGGNIYEARGLANLARQAQLDTVAAGMCSSACTIAFIGGVSRRLATGAQLGFHQYRLDAAYDIPFADPLAEQERDLELFRKNGVEDWFVRLMFQTRPGALWFPSTADLERAGVLISK